MSRFAIAGARLVLPDGVAEGQALIVDEGRIDAILPVGDVPRDIARHPLDGGYLLPGFIDVQVNGGGDALLNDAPDTDTIRTIARAHRRYGTTALMPTLISDDAAKVEAAIHAAGQAVAAGEPGIVGLHVEGPHLNPDKRGIHDPAKIAPLDDAAVARFTRAATRSSPAMPLLLTLAPERTSAAVIGQLARSGVIVSAGHSLADYDTTMAAIDAGLRGFTHLFNAMTQLGSRTPGMVGAALDSGRGHFGLIVDGLHVHPASLRVAIAAGGLDRAMLVTDAMPPAGGRRAEFTLMGRRIVSDGASLRGEDGTLAGSALTMAQAVRNALAMLNRPLWQVSRMASGNPAAFLGIADRTGALREGLAADLVHLDEAYRVRRSWIAGDISEAGE